MAQTYAASRFPRAISHLLVPVLLPSKFRLLRPHLRLDIVPHAGFSPVGARKRAAGSGVGGVVVCVGGVDAKGVVDWR